MPSKFINERVLQKGLANLSLRLANCAVYMEKIESTQDSNTITSHYDLIVNNLNLLQSEVKTLLDSLKDPNLKKNYIETYSTAVNNLPSTTKLSKKAISSLNLKLKTYYCEVKNSVNKQKSAVNVTVNAIEPTDSSNKFKVYARIGTCKKLHLSDNQEQILTYNLKSPKDMTFSLKNIHGELLSCHLKL